MLFVYSEMSDLFRRTGDSEDHNIYLNAADIDDDINGSMNCHRLEDILATDHETTSSLLEPKQEYVIPESNEDDDDDVEVSSDDHNVLQHHQNGITLPVGITAVGPMGVLVEQEFKPSLQMILKSDQLHVNGDDDSGGADGSGGDDDEGLIDTSNMQLMRQFYAQQGTSSSLDGTASDDEDCSQSEHQDNTCQICATVFKNRYNLLRHFQKRHPEFKMYECDLCRISFPSIDEFKDHLEDKHSRVHTTHTVDAKQVRFACDVCGNMYKNKASAMNHLLTHTAKKTVNCTLCDFTCYTKQQLGVHMTKHDKRFACTICHKRFAQKSQLDVHINAVHYNHRPYACQLCKKSFKTKGSHDAHMIVHTDTRNYQCPHCDKKCRKRYDLTLHIRTHTGEKPFKCSVCGRGFVQMCDTRKHEMLHFKPGKRKTAFVSSDPGGVADDE